MAREVDPVTKLLLDKKLPQGMDHAAFMWFLERFAELVRADERNRTWTQEHWTEYELSIAEAEREACAKLCDDLPTPERMSLENEALWELATLDCAEAIRARGEIK
jgi:hypothetical protein